MKYFILPIALFLSVFSLFAQNEITAQTYIDWTLRVIDINILASLPSNVNVLPEAKIQAENKIDEAIPVIIQLAMENALINSSTSVLDRLKRDLHLTSLIDNYSSDQYKKQTNLSKDLLNLHAFYRIPLYPDFCSTFITHKKATPVKKVLHYAPSQNYTGIIIYTDEELPVLGENKKSALNPCLFPRILSQNGEIIFSCENIDPEILTKNGAVLYVDHIDKVPVQRVGIYPLKIEAVAVYGKNKTDAVIPTYLADSILTREHNRKLLSQGKIAIVCSKEKIKTQLYFNR